jgi:uncharacterized protein YggE
VIFAPEPDDVAAERAGAGERIETRHIDVGGRGAEDQIADRAADDVRIRGKSAKAREEAEEVVAEGFQGVILLLNTIGQHAIGRDARWLRARRPHS